MIVDLHPTDDQLLVEESVAGLLARRLPVDRLRYPAAGQAATEHAIWDEFAEIGLFGLGLPEASGGVGYGLPEEVLVARALGRHLGSPAVLATMVAAHLAAEAAEAGLLLGILAGHVRAGFAQTVAEGELQLIDAGRADRLVLLGPQGAVLIDATSLSKRRTVQSIDETLALERAGLPALGASDPAIADRASLLLAAALVGIAQATLDMAVDYAGTRQQFGRPIGAFQAIKHLCADMAVRAAAAEAQLFHAAATAGLVADGEAEIAASRLLAADAALANAKANIQIHGAMGFTAECNAHLYLKRAHVLAMLGSSRGRELRRVLG